MKNQKIKSVYDVYEAFIIDVDGTLYWQFPVRLKMAMQMIEDALESPKDIKYLLGLLCFRSYREKEKKIHLSLSEQVDFVAENRGIDGEELKGFVWKWMFEKPLPMIQKNRRKEICDLIIRCQESRKTIVIYSDYPAEDKLKCLGVSYDMLFYPGHGIPNMLKPSEETMKIIIGRIGVEKRKILYIGDSVKKDGLSAQSMGIDYLHVDGWHGYKMYSDSLRKIGNSN